MSTFSRSNRRNTPFDVVADTPGPNAYNPATSSVLNPDPNKHYGFLEKSHRWKSFSKDTLNEYESDNYLEESSSSIGYRETEKKKNHSNSNSHYSRSSGDKEEVTKLRLEMAKMEQNFGNQCASQEKEIFILGERCHKLDAQLHSMIKEKSNLLSGSASKEKEIDELRSTQDLLRTKLEKTEKSAHNLKEKTAISIQLQKKVDELSKQRDKNKKNAEENEKLKEKLRSYKNQVAAIDQLQKDRAQYKAKMTDLTAQISDLKQQYSSKEATNLEDAKEFRKCMTQQEEKAEAQKKDFAKTVSEIRLACSRQSKELESEREAFEKQKKAYLDRINQLECDLEVTERGLLEKDRQIEKLYRASNSMKDGGKKFEKALEDYQRKTAAAAKENVNLSKTIMELEAQLKSALDKKEKEQAHFETLIMSLESTIEQYQAEITQRTSDHKKDHEEQKKTISTLSMQLSFSEKEIKMKADLLISNEARISDLMKEKKTLQSSSESKSAKISELEKAMEAAKDVGTAKIESTGTEIALLKSTISEMEARHSFEKESVLKDYSRIENDKAELQKRVISLQQTIDANRGSSGQEMSKLINELDDCRCKLGNALEEYQNLQLSKEYLESEYNEVISALNAEISQHKEEMNLVRSNLDGENAEYIAHIDALKKELSIAAENHIQRENKLETEIDILENSVSQLKIDLKDISLKFRTTDETLKTLKDFHEIQDIRFSKQIKDAEIENQKLKQKIQDLTKTESETVLNLKAANQEEIYSIKQKQQKDLEEMKKFSNSDIAMLKSMHEKELFDMKTEVKELKSIHLQELADMKKEIIDLKSSHRQELSDLSHTNTSSQHDVRAIQEKLNATKEDFDEFVLYARKTYQSVLSNLASWRLKARQSAESYSILAAECRASIVEFHYLSDELHDCRKDLIVAEQALVDEKEYSSMLESTVYFKAEETLCVDFLNSEMKLIESCESQDIEIETQKDRNIDFECRLGEVRHLLFESVAFGLSLEQSVIIAKEETQKSKILSKSLHSHIEAAINDFEQRNVDYDEINIQLSNAQASLKAKEEEVLSIKTFFTEENDLLKSELEGVKEDINTRIVENQTLMKTVGDFELMLKGLHERNQELEQQFVANSLDLESANTHAENLNAEIEILKESALKDSIMLSKQADQQVDSDKRYFNLKTDFDSAQEAVNYEKGMNVKLQNQLEIEKRDRAELEQFLTRTNETNQSLEDDLLQIKDSYEHKLKEAEVKLEKALETLDSVRNENLKTSRSHNVEITNIQEKLRGSQAKIVEIETKSQLDASTAIAEADNLTLRIQTVTYDLDCKTKECCDIMSEFDNFRHEAERDILDLKTFQASKEKQFDDAKSLLHKEMSELMKTNFSERTKSNEQLNSLRTLLKEKDAELESFQTKIKDYKEEHERIRTEGKAQYAMWQKEINLLQTKNARDSIEYEQNVQDLTAKLAGKHGELQVAKSHVQDAATSAKRFELRLSNETNSRDLACKSLEAKLKEQEKKNHRLEKELQASKTEIDRFASNSDTALAIKAQSMNHVKELETQISELHHQLAERERDESAFLHKLDKLEVLLQESKRNQESEKENFGLQLQLLEQRGKLQASETKKISELNADLFGHANTRQKIKHVATLKDENMTLREQNLALSRERDIGRRKVLDLEREVESLKVMGTSGNRKLSRVGRSFQQKMNINQTSPRLDPDSGSSSYFAGRMDGMSFNV